MLFVIIGLELEHNFWEKIKHNHIKIGHSTILTTKKYIITLLTTNYTTAIIGLTLNRQ